MPVMSSYTLGSGGPTLKATLDQMRACGSRVGASRLSRDKDRMPDDVSGHQVLVSQLLSGNANDMSVGTETRMGPVLSRAFSLCRIRSSM